MLGDLCNMLTDEEELKFDRLTAELIAFRKFKLKHKEDRISFAFFKCYKQLRKEKTKLDIKKTILPDECSHVDTEDLENDNYYK